MIDRESLAHRRRISLAQLDAFIDVRSAWSGRYVDDDWPVDIQWVSDVIGKTSDYECGGHLVNRENKPAFGWKIERGCWRFDSLERGFYFTMTRREFRELARKNNVSLPSRHATQFIEQLPQKWAEVTMAIHELRYYWGCFKRSFELRREDNIWFAMAHQNLQMVKFYRDNLWLWINRLPA